MIVPIKPDVEPGEQPPRKSRVVRLGNVTSLDLPADRILESHIGELEGVVIMGFNNDGEEVFASSYADGGTVIWLLERLKKRLLEYPDET